MTMIQGGPGGQFAGVSALNRLLTSSENFNPDEIGALNSPTATFSWNSLAQTLTTTGLSGILYVQNTDPDRVLLIRYINLGLGKSTGGNPGNMTVTTYLNASALTGTLISAGTGVNGVSRNAGVASLALATSWAGTEGKTITNGTVLETNMMKDQLWQQMPGGGLVLPTNASMAIAVTPGASTTSVIVTAVVIGTYVALAEAVV